MLLNFLHFSSKKLLWFPSFATFHFLAGVLVVVVERPLVLGLIQSEPVRDVLVQACVRFLHARDGIPEEGESRSVVLVPRRSLFVLRWGYLHR